jgi:lipid II:glycine glycyltransferase (peptidoglycan interpeptide bridge formation enzyme)
VSHYHYIKDPKGEFLESFWQSSQEGNYFQSYEYGEILKKASPKIGIARLGINFSEKTLGVAQGTYSSFLDLGMTLQVICGPVISAAEKDNLNLAQHLVEGLEQICHDKHIIRLEIWPLESLNLRDLLLKNGYALIGNINDYIISLDPDSQKLWNNIHHNKRRNVRMAERDGVEIILSQSHDDVESFCFLHEAAAKRDGFSPIPRAWFEEASKFYKPESWRIFLAKLNGKSIAGVFSVSHRKTCYALRAGSLTETLKVRPNDLMHWKAMEWACANGYSKYNMGMVDDPVPTEKSAKWGIWRWKKEWNGYLEKIEIFEKTILPQYKIVINAKNLAQRIIKRFQ